MKVRRSRSRSPTKTRIRSPRSKTSRAKRSAWKSADSRKSKTRALDAELKGKGLAGLTIRTFDTFAVAYQALKAGQIDAVTSIDGVAKEYQDRGDFTRAISGLYPAPVALAFKNKELAEAVKGVLDDMKKDGSFDKLFASYGVPAFTRAVRGARTRHVT